LYPRAFRERPTRLTTRRMECRESLTLTRSLQPTNLIISFSLPPRPELSRRRRLRSDKLSPGGLTNRSRRPTPTLSISRLGASYRRIFPCNSLTWGAWDETCSLSVTCGSLSTSWILRPELITSPLLPLWPRWPKRSLGGQHPTM